MSVAFETRLTLAKKHIFQECAKYIPIKDLIQIIGSYLQDQDFYTWFPDSEKDQACVMTPVSSTPLLGEPGLFCWSQVGDRYAACAQKHKLIIVDVVLKTVIFERDMGANGRTSLKVIEHPTADQPICKLLLFDWSLICHVDCHQRKLVFMHIMDKPEFEDVDDYEIWCFHPRPGTTHLAGVLFFDRQGNRTITLDVTDSKNWKRVVDKPSLQTCVKIQDENCWYNVSTQPDRPLLYSEATQEVDEGKTYHTLWDVVENVLIPIQPGNSSALKKKYPLLHPLLDMHTDFDMWMEVTSNSTTQMAVAWPHDIQFYSPILVFQKGTKTIQGKVPESALHFLHNPTECNLDFVVLFSHISTERIVLFGMGEDEVTVLHEYLPHFFA